METKVWIYGDQGLPASLGGGYGDQGLPASLGGGYGDQGLPASLGGGYGDQGLPASLGGRYGDQGLPASIGGGYGDQGLLNYQDPPLGVAGRVRRNGEPIRLVPGVAEMVLLAMFRRLSYVP